MIELNELSLFFTSGLTWNSQDRKTKDYVVVVRLPKKDMNYNQWEREQLETILKKFSEKYNQNFGFQAITEKNKYISYFTNLPYNLLQETVFEERDKILAGRYTETVK